MFLAVFANGSMGTFESTRYARGRKNYNTFELNGENGSVFFDLEDPHILQYFRYADPATGKKIEDHLTGWQRIHVTNFEHPVHEELVGARLHDRLRAHVHQRSGRLPGQPGRRPAFQPNMRSALRTQRVCDAVLDTPQRGAVGGNPLTMQRFSDSVAA